MVDLKNIFENRINIDPQVRSINGLFFTVDTELEKTNFEPPYQRNYVWDDEKASYFIESIFLGTEVPPIIMFKSVDKDGVNNFEVIDGRQRYQTIIRFINGELRLKKSGLQKLCDIKDFVGKSYVDLDDKYKTLFKFTNIRTIIYNFIGSYKPEEEEAVKREIFQRYNSGITPLKTYEIDKAQYFHNDFNQSLKEMLCESDIEDKVTRIFKWEKLNVEQKAIKARELIVLPRIPIKYFANKKGRIVEKYFEYISTQFEEEELINLLCSFRTKIGVLSRVYDAMINIGVEYNKFYFECLFWAMCVMDQNGIEYDLDDNVVLSELFNYLNENRSDFTIVRSSFYKVLVGRYETIAKFFEREYGCSFKLSIDNNDGFRLNNHLLSKEPSYQLVETMSFEELRIKKPEPVAIRIPELLDLLQSTKFLLRPSYQRAEVKNKRKASSIIESMLLGIALPPIFVYKKSDETYEVVDGQQRLLSIISFLGKTYKDENGVEQTPYMHDFKLDLGKNSILGGLNGTNYKSLSKVDQNKIRTSSIYMIEIKAENNIDFDPVDLFVRLNNKPYPISPDSFEMWNSFAPRNIINLVKMAVRDNEKWFYLRKNNAQMDNENLLATLAYFQYMYMLNGNSKDDVAPLRTIESFIVDNRVSCRFRTRNDITKLMYEKENKLFIEAINRVEFDFVRNLKVLLSQEANANLSLSKELDALLHVENSKRTQMSFYVLWLLLHDLSNSKFSTYQSDIKAEIGRICDMTTSCTDIKIFKDAIKGFRSKYDGSYHSVNLCVNDVINNINQTSVGDDIVIKLYAKPSIDGRFETITTTSNLNTSEVLHFKVIREGFLSGFVEAYLRSRLFYRFYNLGRDKINTALNFPDSMPFASEDIQMLFIKVLSYVDASHNLQKRYFERFMDLMFYELYFSEAFKESKIHFIESLKSWAEIATLDKDEQQQIVQAAYNDQTRPDNIIGLNLLKAIDMAVIRTIEDSLKR